MESHAGKLAFLVAVAAVAAGCVYSISQGQELRFWDEREYRDIAAALSERGEFVFNDQRAFRPPGYPALLCCLIECGLSAPGMRMANFVLLAGCMGLLYRMTTRLTGHRLAGLLAAVWPCLYPVVFYTASLLYPQTLAAFLLLLAIEIWVGPSRSPLALARATMAGGVFGLLVLTVPAFLCLLPVLVLWRLVHNRRSALLPSLVLCAAALATLAPWTIRNYMVFDRMVLVATNSGINLLIGNSENSEPGLGVATDLSRYLAIGQSLGEIERDAYYRESAIAWIKEHPREATGLYLEKLAHHFACDEQLATAGEESKSRTIVMTVTYLPLLLLALLRVSLVGKRKLDSAEWLLVMVYLGHALASAVFFTRIRFRLPTDFLLMALAASSLSTLLRRRQLASNSRPVPGT